MPGVAARTARSPSRLSQSRHWNDIDAPCHRACTPCRPSCDSFGGGCAYYRRLGFSAARTRELWMPGGFERGRLLALELKPEALKGARGMIGPTGLLEPKSGLNALIAASEHTRHAAARR